MIQDVTYGIIPLKKINGEWYTYLVQHHMNSYWGFPKGHAEAGETPQQCAIRELYEETRLSVACFMFDIQLKEEFIYKENDQDVFKTVHYFIAEVLGDAEIVVDQEIMFGKWVSLDCAVDTMTHETGKKLCMEVEKLISAGN